MTVSSHMTYENFRTAGLNVTFKTLWCRTQEQSRELAVKLAEALYTKTAESRSSGLGAWLQWS